MISSPGCQCLIAGASGSMSTRFWIISRPGMLRSCFWRSVRVSPGTCCNAMTSLLSLGRGARVRRGLAPLSSSRGPPVPKWPERSAKLPREDLRLFPGGEVAALLGLVEVRERRVELLRPAARRAEDLAGEGGEADGDRDFGRRRARGEGCGPSALPVRSGRRGAGGRQPVHGDVVEDVVARQTARRLPVD